MKLLSSLARALVRPDFVQSLRQAAPPLTSWRSSTGGRPGARGPTAAAQPTAAGEEDRRDHRLPDRYRAPYMAADAPETGRRAGRVQISVETQGSSGSTPCRWDDRRADAVIFATDVGVRTASASPGSR